MPPESQTRLTNHTGPDPLGVLQSCLPVVEGQPHVTVDREVIAAVARRLAAERVPPPQWDTQIHFQPTGPDRIERTIGWIFALDALNFCFWAQGGDPTYRWRIRSGPEVYDGYLALAIALRDAARQGTPLWDPSWLTSVDEPIVRRLFRPESGSAEIPLLADRVNNLRELGTAVAERGPTPFTSFVATCEYSAPAIARNVVGTFPSFNDCAIWTSPTGHRHEAHLHKRAQILASDLAGALAGTPHAIRQGEQLTAFADYKVPQVLRHLGILRYRADLAETIHQRRHLASGSTEEVAIRSATVWACEWLRQALSAHGAVFTAADVDWLLWNQGQQLPATCEPYHRTTTIFY